MGDPDLPRTPSAVLDRLPLSFNQEFLCMLDKGDEEGAFGPRHTVVFGWRVTGPLDPDVLRGALLDVVTRHEALRTSLVRDPDDRHQRVHPPGDADLVVRELDEPDQSARELRAEQFLNEIEFAKFRAGDVPVLHAVLGRFDDHDAVLVLATHHTTTDSWSTQVIIRDLATCYAVRRGHQVEELPEAAQYREYTAMQRERLADPSAVQAREYWGEKLRDSAILALPTDRARSASAGKESVTAVNRFLIAPEVTKATLAFARSSRTTPFMVLIAAYNVFLHKRSGATDIAVPTITSGRTDPVFNDTVGIFFNFVPLRTDITGCETFRQVVDRTRATCIEAYVHDIPFAQIAAEAPGLMVNFAEDNLAVCAFEVFQFPTTMDHRMIGDLEFTEIRRRLLSQSETSDIPDGALWTLDVDPSGDMVGSLKYTSNVFDADTMEQMVDDYRSLLGAAVANPDRSLVDL